MNIPFFEVINAHPNEKLIDIVENRRKEYNPEALAAAEEVLRKRGVKWNEVEQDEVILMTIEEIREEIAMRLANGETIENVRLDLKSKGLDIMEYAELEQEQAAKEDPRFASRRLKAGAISSSILLVAGLFLKVSRLEEHPSALLVFVSIGIVIVVVVVLMQKKEE